MKHSLLWLTILIATATASWPALAQVPSPGNQIQNRWPTPPARQQPSPWPEPQAPAQTQSPAPAQPSAKPTPRQVHRQDDDDPKPQPKPRASTSNGNTVTCGGTFSKTATHLTLSRKYNSRNVEFGEVDGPGGTKLKATVLFPDDARRRLEVLWNDEASRTDLSLVAINGRSQWSAPRGLKLGTSLSALERVNGRPFKLTGLDAQGYATVLGWEGGSLTTLPGGCRVGVRLSADASADSDVRAAVAGQQEIRSSDPKLKAVKPAIAEILIGF